MRFLVIVKEGLNKVFSNRKYLVLAALFFLVLLFFALSLPNLPLLSSVLFSSDFSVLDKASFVLNTFLVLGTNFKVFSAVMLVFIALLFSLNITMLIYYFKTKGAIAASGSTSLGGMISGLLGVGCASCGSVVLSLFGLSGAALALPLGGEEFNILAVVLLLVSLYVTSKRITQKTCAV